MEKMVSSESEMPSPGEVESPMQSSDQQQQPRNNNHVSELGRQSSVYSLTLDEFQNTLNENGKNFGSMNMDEFITSIWNAEENQQGENLPATVSSSNANLNNHAAFHPGQTSNGLAKQPSLPRQGSFSLPAPMSRKTVDEVWSEIQRGQHPQHPQNQVNGNGSASNNFQNSESTAERQPTFGEMTLEDFLVKAGIVRENTAPEQPTDPPAQQYGMYPNNNHNAGPSFVSRPMTGMHGGSGAATALGYHAMPHGSRAVIGESSAYGSNGHMNGGYGPLAGGACYGGRLGNGSAYGHGIGMGAPMSPVSSDGMCGGNVDNPFGLGIGSLRGKKRSADGPVEKVVERRQRRMIKNRESAARSRARKQAYTVELEAELNQLREENNQLRQTLERRVNQQMFQRSQEVRMLPQTKAERATEKLRAMRRSRSCPS